MPSPKIQNPVSSNNGKPQDPDEPERIIREEIVNQSL
jgi:hypothetical protein